MDSLRPRLALCALLLAAPAAAELHVYVDEQGRTHVTNDPRLATPRAERRATLDGLWEGDLLGEVLPPSASSSSSAASRTERVLRAAVEDLRRGETERATVALREVLRLEPGRPEAHFHLALIEGRRGRLDAAERHLRAFLSVAGDRFGPWRASAARRLDQLSDERALQDTPAGSALELVAVEHPEFRIRADVALLNGGATDFAATVVRYLGDARTLVGTGLGVAPKEPTGVVLYGKAAYGREHGGRFSFQTVGFFDGQIHVVSNAHPKSELRTLLVHEYTHALFREQSGGDRPFWWNEGLAELFEREAQSRAPLSRGERSALRAALREGKWIPLRRLGPSFAGLNDLEARLAYTEAAAAADWIDRHSTPDERRQVLVALHAGHSADDAFLSVLGFGTEAIDAFVRAELGGAARSASLPKRTGGLAPPRETDG